MPTRFEMLKQAIEVLASEANQQESWLADLGIRGVVNELALNFDDIAPCANDMLTNGELSQAQFALVQELDTYLKRISGPAHPELWTSEAMHTSAEWTEIRNLAREASVAFAIG